MNHKKKACMCIILALGIEKKERKKRRCVKKWITKRNELSHMNLISELKLNEPLDFKNYFRMSRGNYEFLLGKITPIIKKQDTQFRNAITPNEKLAITLRYLATGRTFADLKYRAVLGESTIGKLVIETCQAINNVLKDYIKIPQTEEEWKMISQEFGKKWNFFNYLGAIDGKHIGIRKPSISGSLYYNYKKFFSIVLMAVVNANYEFIMVDVGANGRVSDGGVIFYTTFWQKLANNSLCIPQDGVLPQAGSNFPFVFVGDDAFSMSEHLLKPYSDQILSNEKRIFNYRLSRARRVVENAFGILASRFQIFENPIRLHPQKAALITTTCCFLHNFLIKHNNKNYASRSILITKNIQAGEVEIGNDRVQLIPLQNGKSHNTYETAKIVRDNYCGYFNTIGQVPWQQNFLK